jgi:hypothetical protein
MNNRFSKYLIAFYGLPSTPKTLGRALAHAFNTEEPKYKSRTSRKFIEHSTLKRENGYLKHKIIQRQKLLDRSNLRHMRAYEIEYILDINNEQNLIDTISYFISYNNIQNTVIISNNRIVAELDLPGNVRTKPPKPIRPINPPQARRWGKT